MPETSIAPAEQKSDEFNLKFMTYENTLVLRAFAIISVIFAHTQVWAGFYFNNLGSIMVGLFFFLSGYGLTISKKNKPNYLKTFNRRRWASIFIPTVTTSILSFCIYAVYDAVSTENLYNILYQMVVSPISGFIYQLLIFYVFFYVFNKLFREKTALLMIWAGSGLLLIGNIMGYNADYNYENSFLFAIGATIAVYGDALIKFTRKNYNKLLTVIGIVLLFACINFSLNVRYDVTYNLITTVSVLYVLILTVKKPEYNYPVFILILFMIFVMYGFWPDINTGGLDIMRDMTLIACLSSLLNNSNGMLRRAFNIIGSVTLEMYIIHWPLYNVVWSITSTAGPYMPILTTVLMIVFTLTLAIPLNYMNSYLLKSHANIVKRIWKRYDICIICLITVFLVLRQFMIINIL